MSNFKSNRRKIFYSTCASLLLCMFGSHASELPPDPDNAALLYFQALSLWSNVRSAYTDAEDVQESVDNSDSQGSTSIRKSNEALDILLFEQSKEDRESGRKLKRKRTIDIVVAASQIPQCTWGIYHSKGWELLSLAQLRQLAFLLDDDAQALAAAGDCRAAIEKCLVMRRFARHIGCEEITNYTVSQGVDGLAMKRLRHVLGSTKLDVETLLSLKDQLVISQSMHQSLVKALRIDYERALQKLYLSPQTVLRIRNRFMELVVVAKGKQAGDEFRKLTDEELIPGIREIASTLFDNFFDSLRQAIENDKPFAQTYAEIELLTYKLRGNDAIDPIIPLYDLTHIMHTARFYSSQTNLRASINSVKVAIEIYLIKARTGELPDVLPDGLPKDPFSGQDFEYQKTEQGFILRCDKEHVGELRAREFEFKVRR